MVNIIYNTLFVLFLVSSSDFFSGLENNLCQCQLLNVCLLLLSYFIFMQTITESSGLITAAQSINLDADMDNFMLLTLLKPDQVGEIKKFLSEIMTHVEVIFTNTMPGKITGGMKIKNIDLVKLIF